MSYTVIRENKYCVAAITDIDENFDSTSTVLDFLRKCRQNPNYKSSTAGLHAIFCRYAELGPQSLTTAISHEVNKPNAILEFIKGDLRILYFIKGNTAFLTNGYIKKGQKAHPQEVDKAIRTKKSFLDK